MSRLIVTVQESGERIDALLARSVEGLTRAAAQRLIEDGAVTLRGAAIKKNYKSKAGDEIEGQLWLCGHLADVFEPRKC